MAETVEPWLRGTLNDVSAAPRGVLHALELAREDLEKWCEGLSGAELNARPFGLPSVAFQLRHIARSIDRLLTYAESAQLSPEQLAALSSENEEAGSEDGFRDQLFGELDAALRRAALRVRGFAHANLNEPRSVGRKQLRVTLGGLLVHVADHTQRHAGQAITTAKVLIALRQTSV